MMSIMQESSLTVGYDTKIEYVVNTYLYIIKGRYLKRN